MISDHGRDIIRRKYDAFSTDRAYEPNFSGLFWPLGVLVDRFIWSFPLHQALRGRVRNVSDYLAEITARLVAEQGSARLISAPCGLIKDLIYTKQKLEQAGVSVSQVHFHGLDLDFNGDVIAEARRRADRAHLEIGLVRDDIFNIHRHYKGRFDIVNCIGLISWMELAEVERLVRYFAEQVISDRGYLLIDNFALHRNSAAGGDLEINTRYFEPKALKVLFARAGFELISEKTTSDGINTVYVLRKRAL
ncbi:MAG: hypothetical protein PHG97_02610 [Candidatus Margulisbacteria bacterium]|nr:hypothetical protein [Candidatus Margulisiibacteriota bacterium]